LTQFQALEKWCVLWELTCESEFSGEASHLVRCPATPSKPDGKSVVVETPLRSGCGRATQTVVCDPLSVATASVAQSSLFRRPAMLVGDGGSVVSETPLRCGSDQAAQTATQPVCSSALPTMPVRVHRLVASVTRDKQRVFQ